MMFSASKIRNVCFSMHPYQRPSGCTKAKF